MLVALMNGAGSSTRLQFGANFVENLEDLPAAILPAFHCYLDAS
jgi:hypothetical protein